MSKTIEIICNEKNSEEFINILPASQFVPEWYRVSKSTFENANTELLPNLPSVTTSTYKKCTPFLDALTAGYMVFLTADLEVTKKPDGMPFVMWRTSRTVVTDHDLEQWKGLPCPEGYYSFVYKWHNQFVLKTPKEYSLLFLSPINRFDLPFQTITGIVDTDKYELSVHFPFFIKNNFTGIIEKGTPIAQIIPIKRDSWKRNVEPFDENKTIIRSEKYKSTIKRSYKNNIWFKKEYK